MAVLSGSLIFLAEVGWGCVSLAGRPDSLAEAPLRESEST